MCLLNFARFCSEFGSGNVTIGFLAKNYTGYTNFRPNWRHEALFYEHFVFCCFYSELGPGNVIIGFLAKNYIG